MDRGDILGLLRNEGICDKFTTGLVRNTIKEGNVFVDIGAHIGYFSLLASALVGKKGEVFSFEPDEATFSILSKNITVNKTKNIRLNKMGVSDATGVSDFYVYGSGLNSLGNLAEAIPDHLLNKKSPIKKIEITTLDNFFKNKKIDFIKMDIEGGEGLALRGATNVLKNPNLKILTEFNIQALECASKMSGEEFLKILFAAGFKIYNIDDDAEKLSEVTPNMITQFVKKTAIEPKSVNLWCIK